MKKINYLEYTKPTDYLKFPEGDTKIRIVSSGGLFKKHGLRTANAWVNLGDCTEDAKCEHCLKGNVAKDRWLWIAYEYGTDKVKLLEAGAMLGDRICKIAQERQGQDPQEYDLIITKSGQGMRSKYTAKVGEVSKFNSEDYTAQKRYLINKYMSPNANPTPQTPQTE